MTTTMTDLATGRTFVFNEALPGRDAYEEALAAGFEGDRAAWLAHLRGFAFNPATADWEVDRLYSANNAVRHANKLWVSVVDDVGTEPGTDAEVWVLLLDGADAADLAAAVLAAGESATAALGYRDSASAHRLNAQNAQTAAEVAAAVAAAQAPAQATQSATLAAALGQAWREIARLGVAQEGGMSTLRVLVELISIVGQIADQTSGGQIALRGGSLADPALRIGTAGLYSSAANTLSIAIGGIEVARFTPAGLTIYGIVSEA